MKEFRELLFKVREVLSPRGRVLFIWLALFSVITAFFEALSVSVLAPFIALATDFDFIHQNDFSSKIYKASGFSSEATFVVAIGVCALIIYIIRSALSLANIYLIARFSNARYFHLSTQLFSNYLQHSLVNYSKRNISDLTRAVMSETNQLTQMFSSLLMISTEIVVFVLLYSIMLYTDYQITLILSVILAVFSLFLLLTVSARVRIEGARRVEAGGRQFRALSSAFGNFRILKLQSSEKLSLSGYLRACSDASQANTIINTLQNTPRLVLDLGGFGLMVLVLTIYIFLEQTSIKQFIPIFALFALALYRLLPSLNRVLTSYNSIIASAESLKVVYNELSQSKENLGDKKIVFNQQIKLDKVGYFYEDDKQVLLDINLTIKKGERIALIGESGQGKSTLIDLIIGLLHRTSGDVWIDGELLTHENLKSWRKKIGYIPQTVYLFDASVAENVVFGREFDIKQLHKVLKQANILDFLNTKEGVDTLVGDAGVMLSGGQRQRIAIARALYGKPEILVLDEATSALDLETESKILDELKNLGLDTTIITVTHRRESLSNQQTIYLVDNKGIKRLKNEKKI